MSATTVEQESQHVHDLLFLRDLFTHRGVSNNELRRYDAAIQRARERLAEAAQSASVGLAA